MKQLKREPVHFRVQRGGPSLAHRPGSIGPGICLTLIFNCLSSLPWGLQFPEGDEPVHAPLYDSGLDLLCGCDHQGHRV